MAKPTEEDLRKRAADKHPYVIGDGAGSLARQRSYLKRLFIAYGYPSNPQSMFFPDAKLPDSRGQSPTHDRLYN